MPLAAPVSFERYHCFALHGVPDQLIFLIMSVAEGSTRVTETFSSDTGRDAHIPDVTNLQEIAHFMPDLIALQEVDHLDHFQGCLHNLGCACGST